MSATERERAETTHATHALYQCLLGIEQHLSTIDRRLGALEERRSTPAPEVAQLQGLDKLRSDIDDIWTTTGQLPGLLRALNVRLGEVGEGVELALVALPRDAQRNVYRTRASRAQRRWVSSGD